MDEGGDGGGEQAGTGVSGVQAAAKFGGGYILVDGGEEVDTGALGLAEGERRELGFGKREFGTADDDPLGEREQAAGRAPAAEVKEAVGSGEDEEGCAGQLVGKGGEAVDGVVRAAIGAWGIEGGDGEAGVGC